MPSTDAEIKKLIAQIEHSLAELKNLVELNGEQRGQHDAGYEAELNAINDLPGIEGIFDGLSMVTKEGEKFEVPANYAAKTRLVYGDGLKLVEQDGKKLFKLVNKIERREVEGVVAKRTTGWFFLSDAGLHRISNTAAEFNNLKDNDEVIAILPANNSEAPFAALDRVVMPEKPKQVERPAEAPKVSQPTVNVSQASVPPTQQAKPQQQSEQPQSLRTLSNEDLV